MNHLLSQVRIRFSHRFLFYFLIFALFIIEAGFRSVSADWIKDSNENMPVCTAKNEQHFPSLTSDGRGGLIVAWRDARNANRDVFAQRVSLTGEMLWGDNGIPVCDLPSAQSWPSVIPDESGGEFSSLGIRGRVTRTSMPSELVQAASYCGIKKASLFASIRRCRTMSKPSLMAWVEQSLYGKIGEMEIRIFTLKESTIMANLCGQ